MAKTLQIRAKDNNFFDAYVDYPETDEKAPAVIVIQEIFGVNDNMKEVCAHLSQAGFIAVCPDLFWRLERGVCLTDKTEAEWAKAFDLFNRFDVDLGVADLIATLSHIRRDPACSGKAGTMGYCLGGRLAYLMAARSDADCNIGYYGVGIEKLLEEAPRIKNPLLLHIAEKDAYVPLEAQRAILDAAEKNPAIEACVYPGVDHAFSRIGGKHYDRGCAQEANYRSADFLARHLSGTDEI